MKPNLVTLRVWGDFACFTRPEMKVERVSYPVITPSAARGVLEAVFWEPQMYYLVDSVRVVKKGRWVSFRRNEVTKVISLDSVKTWMHSPEKTSPIQAGGGAADGTQRNMLALQDVEYLISAEVRVTSLAHRPEDSLAKYFGEIERRAHYLVRIAGPLQRESLLRALRIAGRARPALADIGMKRPAHDAVDADLRPVFFGARDRHQIQSRFRRSVWRHIGICANRGR